MYTSKNTKKYLLECIKFTQRKTDKAVVSQLYGLLFGIEIDEFTDPENVDKKVSSYLYGPLFEMQIDKFTDFATIEWLGIIQWYVYEEKSKERQF